VLDGKIIGTLPSKTGPTSEGSLCIKGWNGHEFVQHQDRLLSPTIRQDRVAREVSWDAALDHAAAPYALKPPASTSAARLLAGRFPSRRDLAQLGHGAFCLECKSCTFPKCLFGK